MTKDELLQKVIEYIKENGIEMTEELLFSKSRNASTIKYRHIFVAACYDLVGVNFSEISNITGLKYWNTRHIVQEFHEEFSYKKEEYNKFKLFLEKENSKNDYITILIKKTLLKNTENMIINDNSLFNSLINRIK